MIKFQPFIHINYFIYFFTLLILDVYSFEINVDLDQLTSSVSWSGSTLILALSLLEENFIICCLSLQTAWTQIRPIEILGLIWIQIVWHWLYSWRLIFEKKKWKSLANDKKACKNYPACIELISLWINGKLFTGLPINQKIGCKIVNIFLPINFNMSFGCSKEPSQWEGSFEYPQHMFWLRNKKINFWLHTLIWRQI